MSGDLAPWVREIVGEVHGLEIEPRPGDSADVVLTIDGRHIVVQMKTARSVDAAVARLLGDAASTGDPATMVVADTITAQARRFFEDRGVGYIDGQGNAHLRAPGIYLHVGSDGRARPTGRTTSPTRLSGRAGLVAQVLLLEPGRSWQVAELAAATKGGTNPDATAVSIGLVHRVLVRLESVGVLRSDGVGPRRRRIVTNTDALLDLLSEENTEPGLMRFPLYVYEPVPGTLGRSASRHLQATGIRHALTGVAAAAMEAPALTSVLVTQIRIQATADPADVTSTLSARAVERGANCVLLQGQDDTELVLRRDVRDVWLAAPTRVYLDALHDPRRGQEQAEQYRRQVLRS